MVAVAVGLVVLTGWASGIDLLQSLIPGTLTMKANTAVCFILLGGSLIVLSRDVAHRWWRPAGYALAAGATLLAGLVGMQYLIGRDLGIDQLLFVERPGAVQTVHLGRLSPQTVICFLALGVAVLLARRPAAGAVVTMVAAVPLVLGLLNVIEVTYRAGVPTFLAGYTQMALPTAVTVIIVSAGVTGLRPGGGWLAVFFGRRHSSRLARWLLLAALVIPIALGWLRLQGERLGLYEGAYGVSLMALASVLLLVIVVRQAAAAQARVDARRAQAELAMAQAREHAERANRAKSEFLSRMSHELRTPLNAILGFGQLLEMDQLSDEQRESVGYIVKGGQHLLRLIDDVLDIARVETGRLSMSPEPVLLDEVADEAVALVRASAAEAGISVALDTPPGSGLHVLADRQRLRQVLLNLLTNAVKYNRPGGSVTVTYTRPRGGRVRLSVTDEGAGIDPSNIARLFLPFERLGAASSAVEGTGIGLALSKALAEAMGGTIGVHSEVGQGSTFWIELAVAESPLERFERLQRGRSTGEAGAERTSKKLVYVEDNASNVKFVERVLKMRPEIELRTAATATHGLELARSEAPDLVLLDLDLPDLPGEEVLRRLRADPTTTHIPVVVLSADATASTAKRLQKQGAHAYVTKPINVDRFLQLIDGPLGPAEVAA